MFGWDGFRTIWGGLSLRAFLAQQIGAALEEWREKRAQ